MAIDEAELTKGLARKLKALRKSFGDDLAEEVLPGGWSAGQPYTPKQTISCGIVYGVNRQTSTAG